MFVDSLDIANRALQHIGGLDIASVAEDSVRNEKISFAYDKVRRPELRRNQWVFSIRKAALRAIDTTTLLLNPPLWSATLTYLTGAVVRDANGAIWVSLRPENLNNVPGGNNEMWDSYFGPMSVSLYDSTISYFAGELVYMAGATAGTYSVFVSLKNDNSDVPNVGTAWDATVTYYLDQAVAYGGQQWRSLIPFNLNNTPAAGAAIWGQATTYALNDQVTGSDAHVYRSLVNGNLGNDPTGDDGTHWTDTGTVTPWAVISDIGATSWRPLGGTALAALDIIYPLGAGPASDTTTRNIFRLPGGHLMHAPQMPKAGVLSVLGAPGNLPSDDWEFSDQYLVSSDTGPIVYRFRADITRVRDMDDMFCEGLACRVALAAVKPLNQSNVDLQAIASEYEKFMREARLVNAIEIGPVSEPLDDLIACRF